MAPEARAPTLAAHERLALRLYALLMRLLALLLPLKLRRRGRAEPLYLEQPGQRLGHYPGLAPSSGWVWVHAVSLGETRAAALLLPALRQHLPGMRLLLTHGTATGRAAGAALLQPGDVQVWQPWDTPSVVARFLAQFRPALGLVLETEVWPHWVQGCRAQGVPLLLVNARLSAAALARAQRLPWLLRPAYAGLSAVLAQTEADAQRLRQLGAERVQVMGNLKYDVQPDAALLALGQRWKQALGARPVLLLASSREGEEALWLQALQRAAGLAPDLLWLLVPRHPQRFDAVAHLVQQAGLRLWRRSQCSGGDGAACGLPAAAQDAQVWLGDSVGEMHAYYAMADLAWLGGSFLPLGGQNLIESAACGCPLILGPHTFNFHAAAELAVRLGAALRVHDMDAALQASTRLLHDAHALQQARHACATLLQQGQGAALRCVQALQTYWPPTRALEP